MPIPLETPHASIPTVKLLEKGQEIVGYICDMQVVGVTEFNSTAPKLRADGQQATQDKVTLLVKQGTAQVKDGEEYRPVKPGEEVVIWFQGHRRWTWVQGKKEHGSVNVGDVVRVVYTGDEKGQGAMPKKIWAIKLRPGDPEKEADVIALCEELYHRLRKRAPVPIEEEESYPNLEDLPF